MCGIKELSRWWWQLPPGCFRTQSRKKLRGDSRPSGCFELAMFWRPRGSCTKSFYSLQSARRTFQLLPLHKLCLARPFVLGLPWCGKGEVLQWDNKKLLVTFERRHLRQISHLKGFAYVQVNKSRDVPPVDGQWKITAHFQPLPYSKVLVSSSTQVLKNNFSVVFGPPVTNSWGAHLSGACFVQVCIREITKANASSQHHSAKEPWLDCSKGTHLYSKS